jgi:ubiquitin carboxyl-terminal hydrolase 34
MDLGRSLIATQLPDSSIQKLICNSFALLIEASLHDHRFWELIKQHTQFDTVIFSLLLEESRQPIRKEAADNITVVCGSSKSRKKSAKTTNDDLEGLRVSENPTTVDMLATFWGAFAQTFPRTTEYAGQSQEFFEVALCVFRSVAEKSPSDLIFGEYLIRWSEIMLSHETEEVCSYELSCSNTANLEFTSSLAENLWIILF